MDINGLIVIGALFGLFIYLLYAVFAYYKVEKRFKKSDGKYAWMPIGTPPEELISMDSFRKSIMNKDSDIDSMSTHDINPATGLPMIGGVGMMDIGGNPYGTNLDNDWHSTSSNTDCSSFSSNWGSSIGND